jgi:hypothetical protein
MADAKVYAILSVSLVFVGFLVSLRLWTFTSTIGSVFLAFALGLYAVVIFIGIWSYFPRQFRATNARAIMGDLDRPFEVLAEWTSGALLDFAEEHCRIASEKGYWLQLSMIVFMMATLLLGISFVNVP